MSVESDMNKIHRGSPDTRERIIKSLNEVYRPNQSPLDGMNLEFPHLFSKENIHNTYYIEDQGEPVSQASVYDWTCFLNGVGISVTSLGSVSTMKAYRHRGLSTRIIKRIMEDKAREGKSMMLVSGEIELYTKLNCVKTGLVYKTSIGAKNNICPFIVTKISAEERIKNASTYQELYSREPYRYLRTVELTKTLLNALWFKRNGHVMELFEIKSHESLVAYVVVHSAGQLTTGHVMEYAGSRVALVNSLPLIATEMGWETVTLKIHPEDTELLYLMNKSDQHIESKNAQGTLVVLNPDLLIEQINSIVKERTGYPISIVEKALNEWVIINGERTLSTKGIDELTTLLFGYDNQGFAIPLMFTDDMSYI